MRSAAAITLLAALSFATAVAASEAEGTYQIYCAQCHGIQADGNGINAPHMSVQPRDHTDASEMSARTDEELFDVIKNGGKAINKSVLMPAWDGNLSDAQIQGLVDHLRALCCGGAVGTVGQ